MASRQSQRIPVFVNIYDVGASTVRLDQVMNVLGTGAYHAAIQIADCEWSYGYIAGGQTGVFRKEPKLCEMHTYRETVSLGVTRLTKEEICALLNRLGREWIGEDYDLLTCNCCHFSDTFAQELGVDRLPTWITCLALTGAHVSNAGNAINGAVEGVKSQGKVARGRRENSGYEFGDVTIGAVASLVNAGKESRGASRDKLYEFGDGTLGLFAIGGSALGAVAGEMEKLVAADLLIDLWHDDAPQNNLAEPKDHTLPKELAGQVQTLVTAEPKDHKLLTEVQV